MMRSHLTRSVFRRLLSNKPLFAHCPRSHPHRQYSSSIHRVRHVSPCLRKPSSRRSLWGFSTKPPRQQREPQIVPGLTKMVELVVVKRVHGRPPLVADLITAWRAFFNDKRKTGEGVNSLEATHVLRTFRHLSKAGVVQLAPRQSAKGKDSTVQKNPIQGEGVEHGDFLGWEDVRVAQEVMSTLPSVDVDAHKDFAVEAFTAIRENASGSGLKGIHRYHNRYVAVMAQTGGSLAARNVVVEALDLLEDKGTTTAKNGGAKGVWPLILEGFAREGNAAELEKTLEMLEVYSVPYSPSLQRVMVSYHASLDNFEGVKEWYHKPLAQSDLPLTETLTTVRQFCIRNKQQAWGQEVFRELLELPSEQQSKHLWDQFLQWAAEAMGKGVEDVERMMTIMIRTSEENELLRPDSDTINGLVSLAMSKTDNYLAERYQALGLKFGILPNAQTFILQMNYRISAGDLRGAQASYHSLQSEEISQGKDLPVINRYLRAVCASNSPSHELITSIMGDVDERRLKLQPDTVADLCLYHLNRGEIDDVEDVLLTHSYYYTLAERAFVRDAIVGYCLDRRTSNARCWEAYNLFRQVFNETDIDVCTRMMNEFFGRGRSDMGTHAFGHMRSNARPDRRPVIETYIQCLEGIAWCGDRESLDIVHNMLKMDSTIEPNTQLYNALILAYTGCDDSSKAVEFWADITASREGPTYNSLEIIFRACQNKPFGDKMAREIWAKMRRMEIEVTRPVYIAYVGALAGQGKLDEAKSLVEGGEAEFGFKPNVELLGHFYNALPGQNRKDLVEQWGKDLYPGVWAELVKLGQFEHEEGHRLFNLPKPIIRA